MQIVVIIPAYNEEESLPFVLKGIDRSLVDTVLVVNNGSTDNTAQVARQFGAMVIDEPRRGYGRACLAGIAQLKDPDLVVFMDGDFSDYPENIKELLEPIQNGRAELVIGSRVRGECEKGALSLPQRFGNRLATSLLNLFFGTDYTDLGPFRAVKYKSLKRLEMKDKKYGWTIEMQMKAAALGMGVVEVPVSYRQRRAGKSKVSGNIKGVILASSYILYYLVVSFGVAVRRKNLDD